MHHLRTEADLAGGRPSSRPRLPPIALGSSSSPLPPPPQPVQPWEAPVRTPPATPSCPPRGYSQRGSENNHRCLLSYLNRNSPPVSPRERRRSHCPFGMDTNVRPPHVPPAGTPAEVWNREPAKSPDAPRMAFATPHRPTPISPPMRDHMMLDSNAEPPIRFSIFQSWHGGQPGIMDAEQDMAEDEIVVAASGAASSSSGARSSRRTITRRSCSLCKKKLSVNPSQRFNNTNGSRTLCAECYPKNKNMSWMKSG